MNFKCTVNVHIADENLNGPSHAKIELDKNQIKRILKLAKAVKELEVAYISDWDCTPVWKEVDYETEGEPLKDCECRTDIELLEISRDDIHWSACLKNTDVKIETEGISLNMLKESYGAMTMPRNKLALNLHTFKNESSKAILEARLKGK